MRDVTALPPDYDSDPERWAAAVESRDRGWLLAGDVHEAVAERIVRAGLTSVVDVGCGQGRLRDLLASSIDWVGLDPSVSQISTCPHRPIVRGDAAALPFGDNTVDAVAALWVLYHLDRPADAIAEAARVLRPGGLFFACTSARTNDPELCDGYPATTFDAEEAAEIVASAFRADALEVERWDAPLLELPDRDAVARYAKGHSLPAEVPDRVEPPVTLTKRGVLVIASR